MDSNFALAHNQLAQAYLQKHMYEEVQQLIAFLNSL
jgi:hypothetical protein